jgi:hypothetical protein
MAIQAGNQGFFTTSGVLEQEGRAGSSSTSNRSAATGQSTGDATAQEAAAVAAAAITEAVVVKVSSRMNIGGTGFDSGVTALVQGAVQAGLTSINGRKSNGQSGDTQASGKAKGGTYQNSLIAAAAQPSQPDPPAVLAAPAEAPGKSDPPKETGKKEKSSKVSRKSFQDELVNAAKQSAAGKKSEKAASKGKHSEQAEPGVDTVV